MRFKSLFLIILLFCAPAFADVVSVDNTFIANDIYSSDMHSRLNRDIVQLEDGINNIDDAQIKADTLKERSFADEINPRIRTAENACNGLVIDMLPVTAGSLTTNTAAGTAYPYGYRIRKSSTTAHSYTASKWTWVFLDINGDFSYTEGTIGSAVPSTPANSIPIARVSSDSSTIPDVQDLRLSECATVIMDQITHSTYEPTLHDILSNGIPVTSGHTSTHSGTAGWIQGLGIQYVDGNSFKVKSGSAWIGSEYRRSSSDITIPEQNDDPTTGVSGICNASTFGGSTTYDVYAVADEASQKDFSVTACPSGSGCSGCTNYRFLGSIKTSSDTGIVSSDVLQAYSFDRREVISTWGIFVGDGDDTIIKTYNVSSITDLAATGKWTVAWTNPFPDALYMVYISSSHGDNAIGGPNMYGIYNQTKNSVDIIAAGSGGAATDIPYIHIMAISDTEL